MSESLKKKKRGNQSNPTVAARGRIDANWQKLLSTNLMDKKSVHENNKEPYSGTYRRIWKKKGKDHDTVHDNMKSLNITAKCNSVTNNDNREIKNNDINNHANGSINQTVDIVSENQSKNRLTKFLAMDCEMVGIGYKGNDHMLARVSIVNKFGDCVYDKFVKAREEVIDYRTSISGVRKEDLLNGEEFSKVQKEVSEMIKGRVLVGHSLKNDLSVLFLSHPRRNIRDTSRYRPFRKIAMGGTPSLKRLAKELLGIDIQTGEHSSVEDARAVMQLYCTVAKQWESQVSGSKRGRRRAVTTNADCSLE